MALKKIVQQRPGLIYFLLTYALSWGGALLLLSPKLFRGQTLSKLDGLLMFPVMILGPCLASLYLTRTLEGRAGLRRLWLGERKTHFGRYAVFLLLPPILILLTLGILFAVASPAFTPHFFPIGVLFGIPAGILEEVGWTGFGLPALRKRKSLFISGLWLGILWGVWHLPVVDFLGAAWPHGNYALAFAGAFIMTMTAMRLLIVKMVEGTGSLLLAQCMHIVSTGSLVVLGPMGVSPGQEAAWYGCYGILLWVVVAFVYGRNR